MKKMLVSSCFAAAALAVSAATIDKVIVRQQWPWSTDVKVEYLLSGVSAEHPVNLTVAAYEGAAELAVPADAISGSRFGIDKSGIGVLTIDPVKAFGKARVSVPDFKIKLTAEDVSPEDMNEAVYKIFCLTDGTCEDVTRKDLLNGKWGSVETDFAKIGDGFNTTLTNVLIWTAVTNDVKYKTTHLVMRKIPAAGKEWKIGSPTGEKGRNLAGQSEDQFNVKLTDDFYIAVFETTQAQYKKYAGYVRTPNHVGDLLPMEKDHYQSLRGADSGTGQLDPYGEVVNWPTNSHLHTVYAQSDIGYLRNKMGVMFDLPTEAQWEIACRAGTTGALNSGKEVTDESYCGAATISPTFDELGWYSKNCESTQEVGLKRPNAFGLYDMHGNVAEMCLNRKGAADAGQEGADPLVNPLGPINRDNRSARGGSYSEGCGYGRSARRNEVGAATLYNNVGFRFVCPAGDSW